MDLHNMLYVLVQIENKMELQKINSSVKVYAENYEQTPDQTSQVYSGSGWYNRAFSSTLQSATMCVCVNGNKNSQISSRKE
jgi:hypothetical protein